MYKLTVCGICGTNIMQDGCCGSETIIFYCACGEKYLDSLKNKNKKRQEVNRVCRLSKGEK